jgi:hypothetical protein
MDLSGNFNDFGRAPRFASLRTGLRGTSVRMAVQAIFCMIDSSFFA